MYTQQQPPQTYTNLQESFTTGNETGFNFTPQQDMSYSSMMGNYEEEPEQKVYTVAEVLVIGFSVLFGVIAGLFFLYHLTFSWIPDVYNYVQSKQKPIPEQVEFELQIRKGENVQTKRFIMDMNKMQDGKVPVIELK